MAKPGRNDLCPCGSGRKFKKCCESKTDGQRSSRLLMIAVGAALAAAVVAGVASFTNEGGGGSSVRVWSAEHGHYHNENGVQVP